ncbi:hypothetical protein [Kitasatospora cathayae]|uniref:MarR family transcriptional regulator n=1 Tax=Kitasatospora cathayae TaxID=3004092 RepID=A0ABY7QGP2_9ACTN|nr:hypothetical protein [Kitasatospora sp. HUAS 3-15]WBP91949.1 hypothetical protein O1G21_39860 [Kitasatospora sp. HUAS 3-15]
MSRGLGRVQQAVLAHLATEPLGRSPLTGLPVWEPVREIAAAVFHVPQASGAQLASVRRAVRTLAAADLVDHRRLALDGVTYVHQRGTPRRPVPRWEVRIEVCAGAGCPACAAGTFRYPGEAMSLDVINALLEQNGYVPGQVEAFVRQGWHWNHYEIPGPQHRHPVTITVSEGCARRATTPQERAAGNRALDAYLARFSARAPRR